MLSKIQELPVRVAAVIMVLCVLAGVALGNAGALRGAVDAAAGDRALIEELSAERASKASNLLVVARRVAPDSPALASLSTAIDAQKKAKTIGSMAAANREIGEAVANVNDALQARAEGQDKRLLTAANDDFTSLDKRLNRAVSTYNQSAGEAQRIYQSLPTKFFLGGAPEVYQ